MTLETEKPALRPAHPQERPQVRESAVATPYERILSPAATFDLKAWRRERLGRMKTRPEYRALPARLRAIVDDLVRAHESRDQGITVSQGNPRLLRKFGVTR